jgi:glycine hydroxymethyltransferase
MAADPEARMPHPLFDRDPELFSVLERERIREEEGVELIASENFVSAPVLAATGSLLTNKYAEGLPGRRYYGGCEHVDEAEDLARERAKRLFRCEWVNVQPHSGSSANLAVYLAFLKPGETLLGLDLAHGGHLTHGSPVNFSGLVYRAEFYGVEREGPLRGRIDMDRVADTARRVRPRLISIGASAYPRDFDYAAFRAIADEVGAFLWMDMAHPAGLIATRLLNDPLPHCHVVSTTTHKTLRGPRGGMLLLGQDYENPFGKVAPKSGRRRMMSELLDSSVFPGVQGGPLMHVIAAKAVAFGEALRPEFSDYCHRIIANAKALAASFLERGYDLVSGGTDNHLILVDLTNKGLTGKQAEEALGQAGITVNKNMVPFDARSPLVTSGIRIGTPAMTTRGFGPAEFTRLGALIDRVLTAPADEDRIRRTRGEVREMCRHFPLPA